MTCVRSDFLSIKEIQELVCKSNPTLLDIGSNDGSQTNAFLEAFPNCRVFAFEPDPRAIRKWRRNVVSSRATLVETALGAQDGVARFFASDGVQPGHEDNPESINQGYDQSGSLREPWKHLELSPWVKFDRTIDVDVKTLDGWAAENGIRHVDFIWADVQGAEGDLISGGLQTLNRTRYFYTEYSNYEEYRGQITLREIMELLAENFDLEVLWDFDALFRNRKLWHSKKRGS